MTEDLSKLNRVGSTYDVYGGKFICRNWWPRTGPRTHRWLQNHLAGGER